MRKRGLIFLAALLAAAFFPAADAASQYLLPSAPPGAVYRIIEKHNFRKRVNGAYIGAAYREIRGVLRRSEGAAAGTRVYDGRFYVLEETKRAARPAAARVDDSVPVRLTLGPAGAAVSGSPGRFPTMRDFPALPEEAVAPGRVWQAFAEMMLDPDFSGAATPIRVLVEYRYAGPGTYRGSPGHNLTAKYAVRFKKGPGASGGSALDEASGTHDVSIFLPSGEGGPRVISETFKDRYRYSDGRVVDLEGTVLTFFEGVAPLDRPKIAMDIVSGAAGIEPPAAPQTPAPPDTPLAAVQTPAKRPDTPPAFAPIPAQASPPDSPPAPGASASPPPDTPAAASLPVSPEEPASPIGLPDIEVEQRPEGVALTINNLRFQADTAVLLPSEEKRFEALARALAAVPGRTFLIVGHTADLGRPEGQKVLSVERARSVADALEKRGIAKDRLLYEGRGAAEPAASNATEEGRARNRRVEVIILED